MWYWLTAYWNGSISPRIYRQRQVVLISELESLLTGITDTWILRLTSNVDRQYSPDQWARIHSYSNNKQTERELHDAYDFKWMWHCLYDIWYYVCICDCVKYTNMVLIWIVWYGMIYMIYDMNYMIDKMHRYDINCIIEKKMNRHEMMYTNDRGIRIWNDLHEK